MPEPWSCPPCPLSPAWSQLGTANSSMELKSILPGAQGWRQMLPQDCPPRVGDIHPSGLSPGLSPSTHTGLNGQSRVNSLVLLPLHPIPSRGTPHVPRASWVSLGTSSVPRACWVSLGTPRVPRASWVSPRMLLSPSRPQGRTCWHQLDAAAESPELHQNPPTISPVETGVEPTPGRGCTPKW